VGLAGGRGKITAVRPALRGRRARSSSRSAADAATTCIPADVDKTTFEQIKEVLLNHYRANERRSLAASRTP